MIKKRIKKKSYYIKIFYTIVENCERKVIFGIRVYFLHTSKSIDILNRQQVSSYNKINIIINLVLLNLLIL